MPLRIERRTTEKASLTPSPLIRDDGIPRAFGNPTREISQRPGAFAVFRGNHNRSQHSIEDIDGGWDPTHQQQHAEELPALDELATVNSSTGITTISAEVTLAVAQKKRCRSGIVVLAVIAVLAGILVAGILMLTRESAPTEQDESSDDGGGEASHYKFCSTQEPIANSSQIENYDELVAELGVAPIPSVTLCTPQNEALLFVSQEYHNKSATSRVNRFVLATLFLSTEGPLWVDSRGWMTPESECNWYGISCSDDGLVTDIRLTENILSGTLPDEIGMLTALENLVLPGNMLRGTIPLSIQNMTNLATFNVSKNVLEGSPLPFIAQMTWLEELGISYNEIDGTIPDEVGKMTALTHLAARDNVFNGEIPASLGDILTLKILELGGHSISGTLPDSLYRLTNLVKLSIYGSGSNLLTGTLTSELGRLTNLVHLHIGGYHELEASIPSEIGRISNLEKIDFAGLWSLIGTIPSEMARLTKLKEFSLYATSVSGTLPSDLCEIIDNKARIFVPCSVDCDGCCTTYPHCSYP